jgi:autotransporter-associated beta strand protein
MKNRHLPTPKSASASRPAQRRSKPQVLSQSLSRFGSAAAITAALLGTAAVQSPATTFYWDADGSDVGNSTAGANLGGIGTWDTASSLWWDLASDTTWGNTSADIAIFTAPEGSAATQTVTLSTGIIANRASFLRSNYVLTGGDLTLSGSGAGLHANLGESATISSQILGSDGLTKTGGGSIRLTNASNSYTGTTTISNGTLIISDPGQLGADSSAVVVTGFNTNPGNVTSLRGMGGGSLLLDGLSSPITFTRGLTLQGQGPIADRGGALISLGDNTLSGAVTTGNVAFGVTPINTTIISASGTLNLAGSVNIGGTALTTITVFGGTNQGGVSNYNLTGTLTGTGVLSKQGSGALFLTPSSATGFSGSVRTNASNAVGQSSVRIEDASVLGTRTATTTFSVLDLNGGILEVLMDTPLVNAGAGTAAANVYGRTSTTIFADQGVAGTATNQTVNFGQFAFEESQTFNFNSRNGYGMTFGAAPVQGGDNNSTFNNNLQGGTLTFTGSFWSNTNNGANRTLTLGGNGNTLISGNIVASAAGFNHNFTKTGTGTLTVTATGSTLDGNFNINQGTVATRRIQGGILGTGGTGLLQIGSGGDTGTLNYLGAVTTGAGETVTRTLRLNGTAGGARINANQSGSTPTALIIGGPVEFNPTVSTKTLTLGGTSASTIENRINTGLDPGTNTVALTKTDNNTWVLGATNTYTGTTTISGGTLRLAATAGASTVLADVSPLAFNADGTTQGAGGRLLFSGATGIVTTETIGTVSPIAGHGVVRVENGGATTTLALGALSATSGSSAVSINFEAPTASDVITLPGTANTFVQGNAYFNGANFAYRGASNELRAPVYGTDPGFVTSATTLTGGSHNELTGTIGPITNTTVSSLRISGSRTITITGGNTLGINLGTRTVGGIIVTGGQATITGGSVGTFTGNGGALAIRTDALTDSLTLASSANANITAGLAKSGLGTLTLSGSNNQGGGLLINEGTVQLSGSGRIGPNNSNLTIRQNSTLNLNGVTMASGIVAALNGAGTINNTSATAVNLTVGNNNQGGTFSGAINQTSGVISLSKVGSATLTLSGSSNYTGSTNIGSGSTGGITVSGTLANIGSASSIGAGNGTNDTTNRESLVFSGNQGVQAATGIAQPAFLSYAGTAHVTTNRLFSFGAIGAGAGARILANGVNNVGIVFSNTGEVGYVGNAGTATQTLVLGGASTADSRIDLYLRNSSTGGGNLVVNKIDAGKWVLTNSSNDYSGGTKINGGILEVSPTALSANSALLFGGTLAIPTGGVLETSGSFIRALNAGSVANTVNFNANGNFAGSGGFSASGSKLTVNLGGASAPLTWNSGGFLMNGTAAATLRLSSITAQSEVEFQNPIDFGAAARTVQVDDNPNISTDFAHLSGVLSGVGGGLVKAGGGILSLSGANTYTGTTRVDGGSIIIRSFGDSASPGSSSLGDSTAGNTNTGALELGNGGTTGGIVQYIGAGETSDRKIRLNTTTGTTQIHADGSGPLILTNVANDQVDGTKNLTLRGTNASGNRITSVLTNATAGAATGVLSVTVDGSAAWILSGANTYTGNTNANAGALGIGNNSALGTGTLILNNGNVFAYGDDRTLANAVQLQNSTTMGFLGDYNLTFSSALTNASAGNSSTINNAIAAGKALTFTGMTANSLTGNRTLTVEGPGHTIFDGDLTTTTGFGLSLTKTGNGVLELRGTGGNFNQSTVAGSVPTIDIDRGTLRLGANDVIPHTGTAAAYGGITFSPEGAGIENDTATLDLNGFNETITVLNTGTTGVVNIDNTSTNAASLTFGFGDAAVTFGSSTGARTITNSGGGALSIIKTGTAAATIPLGYTLTHTGSTEVNGGGSLSIGSLVDGSPTLRAVGSGSLLALTGGVTSTAVTSVIVEDGATLSLLDGAGNKLQSLTNLQLGSTGGTNTSLNLNVGDITLGDQLNTDLLSLSSGTLSLFAGNQITFNLTDAGLNPGSTYVLLDATAIGGGFLSGALTLADYLLGSIPGGFTTLDLSASTDNQIILTTGSLITGVSYWTGLTDSTWNGTANNWSNDKAGTIPASSIPGQGTDVVFQADANGNGSSTITTTLEQNFKIASLTFEAGTSTTASQVNITPGANPASTLEIAAQSSTAGIAITTGGPAVASIASRLRVTNSQTWNIADSTSALNLSGALFGADNATIEKIGAGTVTLSAAADSSFNNGTSAANLLISGGTVIQTNSGALGTIANGNLASVTLNGGAYYYNNTAAATIPLPLTFNGGTLSNGGNNHTYSGTVAVSSTAGTTLNLVDQNGGSGSSTVTRNITLSGVVSGTGKIVVDSTSLVTSSGNQFNGTVTLNNGSSTWNGPLDINRGTVVFTNVAGSGTATPYVNFNGPISFNSSGGSGRVIYRNVDGASLARTTGITYAAGAIGEFHLDNVGALASNYTITESGLLTLGSSAAARLFLQDVASNLVLTGGVSLSGSGPASISVGGGDADSLVTINTIGISGTGPLNINDDAGGWGQTNSRLQINAASTYTGGTTLGEGILILGNKDAISTGDLTITGTSTLQASANLSGANALANNVFLGAPGNTAAANLTVSGTNNIQLTGTLTGTQGSANRTLTNNLGGTPAATLTLAGVNIGEASNTAAHTLTIAGTGLTTLGGTIADGNAFANSLTITNSNLTTISGANTYSGTTTMNAAAGTLLLQGSNSSTGATTLTAGNLQFDSASNGGLASGVLTLTAGTMAALSPATLSNDTLLTAITATGAQNITINGSFTNNGGNRTLTNNITAPAALTLAGAVNLTETSSTARTLTIAGTGDTVISGVIQNASVPGTAAGVLAKSGTGTLTVSNNATYTGATQINQGTLFVGINDALPVTTAVRLGTGATAGTLDLNGFDQTIGSLTVQTNSTSATNSIIVDPGNTLTINGGVTLGVDANNSTTLVSATGGGSIVVNSGGANFQVGGAVGGTNENTVTADFSGLLNFTANVGTAAFRLGDNNSATGTNHPAVMRLASASTAATNVITAGTIRIGDGSGQGNATLAGTHILVLGQGTNTLNADTINVGSSGNTIRSSGAIGFDLADTTGAVTIRASDGVSRAVLNLVNTTGNTASDIAGTVDFTGHTADVLASTLTMATRGAGSGAGLATLSFDQGTLDVTTLNMASRTGSHSTSSAAATLNLGDSAAPGTPTVNIGALNMAVNTSTGTAGIALADLNVTGGNVSIGTGSGTAINMANAITGRTATSTIDLTGGTVTLSGNIIRTGGAGTENATITLNGSTLDMGGFSIGSGSATITFNAQSGTLQNIAQLNGGGTLTKTTAGTLVLAGTNTYTGLTQVSAGTLEIGAGAGEAIAGDGVNSKSVTDILVDGGTLLWQASNRVGDNVRMNVTSGSVDFSTFDETLYDLTVSGGTVNYGTGEVTIEDPTWSGGTNTISGNTTFGFLTITGGTNTVTGTGSGGAGRLTIGTTSTSGPLEFSGTAATNLTLNSDNATPGEVRFRAGSTIDLIFSGTGSASGSITSAGAGANAGRVNLNGSTRTFNIGDATSSPVDMTISAQIIEGTAAAGITKTGAGVLALEGANTYTGITTINAGTVQISADNNLGAAPGAPVATQITLGGGTLQNVTNNTTLSANRGITLTANSTLDATDTQLTVAGNVDLGSSTLTSTGYDGAFTTINGDITGTGGLTVSSQTAAGHTLILDPATSNTFSGTTTINTDATLTAQGADALGGTTAVTINSGGTLLLSGAGDRVNDSANFTMTDGTFNTAGLAETVGTLTLSGSNSISIIDLAGANLNNILAFAASNGNAWTGQLHIWNFSGITRDQQILNGSYMASELDQVFFGSSTSGLTASQLSSITFFSDAGGTNLGFAAWGIGNNGQIVPVPEPTGVAIGLALFGLAGWRERRRANARRREERAASRE